MPRPMPPCGGDRIAPIWDSRFRPQAPCAGRHLPRVVWPWFVAVTTSQPAMSCGPERRGAELVLPTVFNTMSPMPMRNIGTLTDVARLLSQRSQEFDGYLAAVEAAPDLCGDFAAAPTRLRPAPETCSPDVVGGAGRSAGGIVPVSLQSEPGTLLGTPWLRQASAGTSAPAPPRRPPSLSAGARPRRRPLLRHQKPPRCLPLQGHCSHNPSGGERPRTLRRCGSDPTAPRNGRGQLRNRRRPPRPRPARAAEIEATSLLALINARHRVRQELVGHRGHHPTQSIN